MNFNLVLDEDASQANLFGCVRPAVLDFFSGTNCTIMAYGQTGSGKTHSIFGSNDEPGVLPRILEEVFQQPGHRQLYVSMMEFYCDKIYDLLQKPSPRLNDKTAGLLEIKESSSSQALLPKLMVVPVTSAQQAISYLDLGLRSRRSKESAIKHYSSRSHCIFQLLQVHEGAATMLRVVDLAGSERLLVPTTMNAADTKLHITEVNFINKSLSALGKCINALTHTSRRSSKPSHLQGQLPKASHPTLIPSAILRSKSTRGKSPQLRCSHVPYRDSKLTRVLKDSLELDSSVILLLCVSASVSCLAESLSSLNFGDRAKQAILAEKVTTMPTTKAALDRERSMRQSLESRLQAAEAELDKLRKENTKLERINKSRNVSMGRLAVDSPEGHDNGLLNQSGLLENISWLAQDSPGDTRQQLDFDQICGGFFEDAGEALGFASQEAKALQDTVKGTPKPFGTLKSEVLAEAREALKKLQSQHEVTDSLCKIVDMLESESASATLAQRCWKEFSALVEN
jgi:hypothetical protein